MNDKCIHVWNTKREINETEMTLDQFIICSKCGLKKKCDHPIGGFVRNNAMNFDHGYGIHCSICGDHIGWEHEDPHLILKNNQCGNCGAFDSKKKVEITDRNVCKNYERNVYKTTCNVCGNNYISVHNYWECPCKLMKTTCGKDHSHTTYL